MNGCFFQQLLRQKFKFRCPNDTPPFSLSKDILTLGNLPPPILSRHDMFPVPKSRFPLLGKFSGQENFCEKVFFRFIFGFVFTGHFGDEN